MQPIRLKSERRYLVAFQSKRIQHFFTDMLIIGGGIAGIRAALAIPPDQNAVVVTKDVLGESNSVYAQGGIAGVLDPLDDITNHAADTLATGKGLCDVSVVDMVVREAPDRIRELVAFGAVFDEQDGEIALTLEGGHSHPRVAHALGDATGKEIMRAMRERVRDSANVDVWESTFTIDLLTCAGRCHGAIMWSPHHDKTCVWAKQTVLCTGGAGAMYRETTNPSIATADGHAAAFRAGVELRDMEFMQFHPTVLYIAGSSRHLITEAARGEGAWLVDCTGHRFMTDYHAAGELAPRDVVSQAITTQMDKTNHSCVYLDLTHIEPGRIEARFPHIGRVCAEFGLNIREDRIPVRPGAHYMMGGMAIDTHGRTSLEGLWAAGEATASGLHGANRLASNSLLEGLVFGLRCGRGAAEAAADIPDTYSAPPIDSGRPPKEHQDELINITDVRNSLTSLMTRNVGISRDAHGLDAACRQVEFWGRYVLPREFREPTGWELQNMLQAARLMIASATARTESRGVHLRSDYPHTDDALAEHISTIAEY